MRAAVIFGIAAAVFVMSTTLVVYTGAMSRQEVGWAFLNIVIWLVLVAASAGTMYAVASGTLP